MKVLGFFRIVAALTASLWVLGPVLAQSLPPSPQAPTRYEQCQLWHAAAKVVLDQLSTARAQCSYKITYETMRDQVSLACGGGTIARVCASEQEAASCAYRSTSEVLTACRHAVSVFLKGQVNPDEGLTDRVATDDLRDDLIGGYIGGLPGPLERLDFSGKDFLIKASILKRTWDTMSTPTPDAILSTGQAFASNVFSGSGAGQLASDLFKAASSSVAATGASSIDAMTASLLAFDTEHAKRTSYPAARGIDMIKPAASSLPSTSRDSKRKSNPTVSKRCRKNEYGYDLYWCTRPDGSPNKGSGLGSAMILQDARSFCLNSWVQVCE